MPSFFNGTPQGNRVLPNFHESSPMRSPRDGDATGRQYLRNAGIKAQLFSIVNSIGYLRRELGKLRRIIHGGGTIGGGAALVPEQWNPTKNYKAGQIVFFTPASASAATFYAIQDVAPGIQPDTGSPNWGKFPSGAPGMWL